MGYTGSRKWVTQGRSELLKHKGYWWLSTPDDSLT
jgi:hypothetical protein